jgi:replicative DNA helicase Mcm
LTKQKLMETITQGINVEKDLQLSLLLQIISKEPINILMIGDPATAKTKILRNLQFLVPESDYTDSIICNRINGMRQMSLQQISRRNNSILLDNFDDLGTDGYSVLKEIMDRGISIIAASNPKFGRFDPYDILAKQIDISPVLLNRFDLIYTFKDIPDRQKDEKAAKSYLDRDDYKPVLTREQFIEKIEKCRLYNPQFLSEAKAELTKYYVEMRNGTRDSVPLTLRQLESMAKVAKAHAMLRHSSEITIDDAKASIKILHKCLERIGVDPESDKFDIDRIATKIPNELRKKIVQTLETMKVLEEELGDVIPIADLVERTVKLGVDEAGIEEAIEQLKRRGEVFEIKEGFLKRI